MVDMNDYSRIEKAMILLISLKPSISRMHALLNVRLFFHQLEAGNATIIQAF